MLSVDVCNHVTGIQVLTVPTCSESGSLPVTELVYMIYRFTNSGADWDAPDVFMCHGFQVLKVITPTRLYQNDQKSRQILPVNPNIEFKKESIKNKHLSNLTDEV